jgi:hypothetical protein
MAIRVITGKAMRKAVALPSSGNIAGAATDGRFDGVGDHPRKVKNAIPR